MLNIQGMDISASSSQKWKVPYIEEMVSHSLDSPSIISITETWVKPYMSQAQLAIHGYTLHRADRQNRERGGCCLYIKDQLNVSEEFNFDNDYCEVVGCLMVSIQSLVLCVYRPGSTPHKKFKEVLEFLSSCIRSVDASWTVLITGDLNFPNISWATLDVKTGSDGCRSCAEDLLGFMEEHFLLQVVEKPTRVANNSTANTLDIIITNQVDCVCDIDVQPTTLSDHDLVTAILSSDFETSALSRQKSPPLHYYEDNLNSLNFHKADFNKIDEELQMVDWESLKDSLTQEEFIVKFYQTVLQICSRHAPLKERSKKQKQSKHFKTCYAVNRKRRKVKSKLKALQHLQPHSSKIKHYQSQLLNLEKEAKEKINQSQQEEEERAIKALKENSKYFYSYAKKRKKHASRIGPLQTEENGKSFLSDDPKIMADTLQEQFISVFSDSSSKNKKMPADVHSTTTLHDIVFSIEDIIKAIEEIKTNSASGDDGFPAILLKMCKQSLALPLLLLWKESFSTGQIHPIFLHQLITPIYKGKGSKCAAPNYRPISLTSHLIKVFERVIRKQLVDFLEKNNKINPLQHGFRKGHSCLSELLAHYEEIMKNANDGKGTDTVYLDFAKAFDKVDHSILIKKLQNIGIGGNLLRWIKAFLSNRKQEVVVNGFKSFIFTVLSGVPQGSVLGPILFIIFINDIADSIKHSTIKCFADDSRVSREISNQNDACLLQEDLNRIMKWSLENNMMLNEEKFEFLKHSYSFDSTLLELPFCHFDTCYKTLNGSLIESTDTVKDLGVTFSSNMSFDRHIANAIKQANSKSAWILSVFRTRRKKEMLFFYKTYVRSCLEYCCPLWNPSGANSVGLIHKLESVQRNFTARIPELQDQNYWQRLQTLNLMSLQRRRERYIILYIWKILTGMAPNSLDIHFYSYRNSIKAVVPSIPCQRTNVTRFDRSFSVIGPKLWNILPSQCTLTLHSLQKFKYLLDNFILQFPDQPPTVGYSASHSNSLLDITTG